MFGEPRLPGQSAVSVQQTTCRLSHIEEEAVVAPQVITYVASVGKGREQKVWIEREVLLGKYNGENAKPNPGTAYGAAPRNSKFLSSRFELHFLIQSPSDEHSFTVYSKTAASTATPAQMSDPAAGQSGTFSDRRGGSSGPRRSNSSKVPQKFGSRGRGGGRGKKRDLGRSEWRCVE